MLNIGASSDDAKQRRPVDAITTSADLSEWSYRYPERP